MNSLFYIDEERKSAVDTVTDKIKSLLIERKLKPGDLIPSETALAESLKVSRGSIREAMKILSAYGIIDIKRGAGTYISDSGNHRLFDPLLFKILVSGSDYTELIEVRESMERGVASQIIHHASDEELTRLEMIMQEFDGAVQGDPPDFLRGNQLDIAYHQLMGELTHNKIMNNIYQFVIELFAPTIDSSAGYESHRRMHRAIMARDEARAMELVSEHTNAWRSAWARRADKAEFTE